MGFFSFFFSFFFSSVFGLITCSGSRFESFIQLACPLNPLTLFSAHRCTISKNLVLMDVILGIDGRGLVVSVYACSHGPVRSTVDDLERYEKGGYGMVFA